MGRPGVPRRNPTAGPVRRCPDDGHRDRRPHQGPQRRCPGTEQQSRLNEFRTIRSRSWMPGQDSGRLSPLHRRAVCPGRRPRRHAAAGLASGIAPRKGRRLVGGRRGVPGADRRVKAHLIQRVDLLTRGSGIGPGRSSECWGVCATRRRSGGAGALLRSGPPVGPNPWARSPVVARGMRERCPRGSWVGAGGRGGRMRGWWLGAGCGCRFQ
jgi:hypothetical protein